MGYKQNSAKTFDSYLGVHTHTKGFAIEYARRLYAKGI